MSWPRAGTWLVFATTAVVAYASLRSGSAIIGEPDPRSIGPTVHVAYFWRVALASWLGTLAAAAHARFGRGEPSTAWQVVALLFSVTVALLVP